MKMPHSPFYFYQISLLIFTDISSFIFLMCWILKPEANGCFISGLQKAEFEIELPQIVHLVDAFEHIFTY